MAHMLHEDTGVETRAGEVLALLWPAMTAMAAALLLLLATANFRGLDGLLPAGEPFLPYFTT